MDTSSLHLDPFGTFAILKRFMTQIAIIETGVESSWAWTAQLRCGCQSPRVANDGQWHARLGFQQVWKCIAVVGTAVYIHEKSDELPAAKSLRIASLLVATGDLVCNEWRA